MIWTKIKKFFSPSLRGKSRIGMVCEFAWICDGYREDSGACKSSGVENSYCGTYREFDRRR